MNTGAGSKYKKKFFNLNYSIVQPVSAKTGCCGGEADRLDPSFLLLRDHWWFLSLNATKLSAHSDDDNHVRASSLPAAKLTPKIEMPFMSTYMSPASFTNWAEMKTFLFSFLSICPITFKVSPISTTESFYTIIKARAFLPVMDVFYVRYLTLCSAIHFSAMQHQIRTSWAHSLVPSGGGPALAL